MIIEIIRLSASRPEFLRRSTDSLLEKLKFNGQIKWIFHEDILNQNASEECIKIAHEYKFDIIECSHKPIGHGGSLTWLLNQVKGKYALNWEDDQILLKELDLDRVLYIMEKYSDRINQIAFHKRGIERNHYGWIAKEINLEKSPLVTNIHWAYVPAIWRMEYIMPKWLGSRVNNHHWVQNAALKGIAIGDQNLRDAEWVMENTKTFYWGPIAGGHYIQHIGGGENSLREGKYKW